MSKNHSENSQAVIRKPLFAILGFPLLVAFVLSIGTIAASAQGVEILLQNGYTVDQIHEDGHGEYFEEFIDQKFYGVFTVNEEGYSYWYAGFHDLESARNGALEWCATDVPAGVPSCEVAAYLVPASIGDGFVSGLSEAALEEYIEFLTYGAAKSFAVSPNGAYAYTWDYETQRSADQNALKICNESAEEKSDWEIGQSHDCVLFSGFSDAPAGNTLVPNSRIKK